MAGLIRLGPWAFDADANELVDGEHCVRLTPKASATLGYFLEHPGEVLSRAAITDRVGLSDEGLSRIVNELREALNDQARDSRFIQTIPRKGYRLRSESLSASDAQPRKPALAQWIIGIGVAGLLAAWALSRPPALPPPPLSSAAPATTADIKATLPHPVSRLTSIQGAARRPVLDGNQVWFDVADLQGSNPRPGQRVDIKTRAATDAQWPEFVRHIHPGPRYQARISDDPEVGCSIAIVDGNARPILASIRCSHDSGSPDWSPDGSRLAFTGPNGGITTAHVDSGNVLTLTTPRSGLQDRAPRFHPDNQQISFVRINGPVGELMGVNRKGEIWPITQDNQMVFGHAWVDNDKLLLSSDRTGVRQLWLLDLGKGQWLDYGQRGIMALHYQRPNLVFEMPTYRSDIWLWDGKQARPVVDSPHYDNHPRLSPDGSRLAFVSTRSGATGLWVSEPDGANPRLIVDVTQGRITRPWWRDADRLLYLIYDQGGSRVQQINLENGHEAELIGPSLSPREVVSNADPMVFFLGAAESQRGVFQWLNGQARNIVSGDFAKLDIDAKGNLFLTPADRAEVLIVRAGQSPKPLVTLGEQASLHWTIGGDWLYYLAADGLRRQSLISGANQRLEAPEPSSIGLSLSADAGIQALYIARFHSVRIDLMHTRFTLDP